MRNRIIFDMALTVLLLFEMLYQLTGNTAHEIAGALFFVCIITHLVFNRKWIGGIPKSVSTRSLMQRNKLLFVVVCLLAVDMVLLVYSSVVISETLWAAGVNLTALNPGNVCYPIHVGSSYALCILVLFHLSLHWINVADVLKIEYDPARREAISSGVNALVTIGAIALGIGGIMQTSFEASDFAVNDAEEEGNDNGGKTVVSGYRERNAETGEIVEVKISSESEASEEEEPVESESRCPLCPRQCKLSAPRCERPFEEGILAR